MGEKKVEKFEIKRLKSNISPVTLSEKWLHEFSVKWMSFLLVETQDSHQSNRQEDGQSSY